MYLEQQFFFKMIWDVLTEDEKNKVVLKLMVHVCKADKIFDVNEFGYLIHYCKQLNINPEIIREYAAFESVNEILPESEQDRMNILYHLLFIMNADSHVDPAEEKVIYQIAFRLGFSETMVNDFLFLMKNYKLDNLPEGSMIQIIQKYSN